MYQAVWSATFCRFAQLIEMSVIDDDKQRFALVSVSKGCTSVL